MIALIYISFLIQIGTVAAVCFLWVRQSQFETKVRAFAEGLGGKGSLTSRLAIGAVILFSLLLFRKSGGSTDV